MLPGVRIAGVISSILLGALPATSADATAARLPLVEAEGSEEIAPGKFLVAHRDLQDPNFSRTVVLVLRHDEQGTSGLIINRPTEVKISSLLPDVDDPGERRGIVYDGGPVSRDRVVMLLRSKAKVEESRRIFDDVHVSRSAELLRRLMQTNGARLHYRVYTGHAGWAPGQLAAEFERGDWHVRAADAEMVFDESPHEIWKMLLPRDPSRSAGLVRGELPPVVRIADLDARDERLRTAGERAAIPELLYGRMRD